MYYHLGIKQRSNHWLRPLLILVGLLIGVSIGLYIASYTLPLPNQEVIYCKTERC